MSLGLGPLVPLAVRHAGREHDEVVGADLGGGEPDLDVQRSGEHEVELVEGVVVERRSRGLPDLGAELDRDLALDDEVQLVARRMDVVGGPATPGGTLVTITLQLSPW